MTSGQAVRRVAVLVTAATVAAAIAVGPAQASSPAKHSLEFRPVLAALPAADARTPSADESAAIASCDPGRLQALSGVPLTPRTALTRDACAVLTFVPQQGDGALFVGPARLTATAVASAKSAFQTGEGYVVNLQLTKSGLKAFNRMAGELFSRMPPANEVAMVVDGQVFSNLAVQTNQFSGAVQVSGAFTGTQAKRLVTTINRARRGG